MRLAVLGCALALLCAGSTGCVQRRLTVRSNPPGALVYIGNDEIGTTPVSTDYIYYGQRKIKLVKDGYETLSVTQWIPPPWYQIFPLDFFAENVIPYEIRDERALDFQLQPQTIVPNEQLLTRAENLRQGSKTEGYVPPPRVEQPSGISAPTAPILTPRFSKRDEQETVAR
ncbi:MAG: PEGA domain-containing protein [Planctomycetes bacterium]|nr:PEGA domain-containing protein [Planctomycetota bacterium]